VGCSEEFTVVEFCAGYGGLSCGLKRVVDNVSVVSYVEIEAFCCANLVSKIEKGFMDAAPIWTDVKTFPLLADYFRGKVRCIVAGYPCQPFSQSGKRKGADDPRHLWPYILESIKGIRPEWVFLENVEGHTSLGLREVLTDLANIGYSVETPCGEPAWGIFSAEEVGAPHRRKRVFALAHDSAREVPNAKSDRRQGRTEKYCGQQGRENTKDLEERSGIRGKSERCGDVSDAVGLRELQPERGIGNVGGRVGDGGEELANADCAGLQGAGESIGSQGWAEKRKCIEQYCGNIWPAGLGPVQHKWEPPRTIEPAVGGDTDGYPDWMVQSASRVDEVRMCGNGVVPPQAALAFDVLLDRWIV
jgi:DNA (cytosine-5)-methyltransferase 1